MLDDLSNKRRFINRCVFPYGPVACKELGIIPPSEDVSEIENRQAEGEMNGAALAWGEFIMQRVHWYTTSYGVLRSEHPVIDGVDTERDTADHLAAFAAAVLLDVYVDGRLSE